MDKRNSYSTSNNTSKNLKLALGLAALLSFSACEQGTTIETKQPKIIEQTSIQKGKKIENTREYKVYKLKLHSIVNLKSDMQKAWQKIQNTPELNKILTKDDIAVHTLLPQIIKESGMNNEKTSKSGAKGYMMLMDIAITEIYRHYDVKGLHLDKNNPIDNLILGGLYRNIMKQQILSGMQKRNITRNEADIQSLTILSYNVGITRLFEYIDKSKSKTLEQLLKYLAKHIGVQYNPTTQTDPTYKIQYIDIFGGEKVGENASRANKKIYEGCRYENIIKAMSKYLETSDTIYVVGKIELKKQETLFSKIKHMKEQGIFQDTASVNTICKIILETNGFRENETPTEKELLLIQEPLQTFLK